MLKIQPTAIKGGAFLHFWSSKNEVLWGCILAADVPIIRDLQYDLSFISFDQRYQCTTMNWLLAETTL